MIHRTLSEWLEKQKQKQQVTQILGMRQTGKTTLMQAFRENFPGSLNYPFQDLLTLQRYEGHETDWVLEIERQIKQASGTLHVFVDEIQKLPKLFQGIQGLYDQNKGKVKFWIWGSSARAQKRKNAETLVGRVLSKTLWPLSQEEVFKEPSIVAHFFDLEKTTSIRQEPRGYRNLLSEWFSKSLFPEPFLQKDLPSALEQLENYISTYLENEIRRENIIEDVGSFSSFLKIAGSENAMLVNFSKISSALQKSSPTIKNYYSILEDTFVVKMLQPFSQSVRVQIAKSPKVFFTDPAIARFLAGYRGSSKIGTRDWAFSFESFVFNQIACQLEYQVLPWKISFFRTKSGVEVDFVLEDPEKTVGIEVKAKEKITGKDCVDLKKFMELCPSKTTGIIISLDPRFQKVDKNIWQIPAWML